MKYILAFVILALLLSQTTSQGSTGTTATNSQSQTQPQTCEQICEYYDVCIAQCERKKQDEQRLALIIGITCGILLLMILSAVGISIMLLRPCLWCPTHFYQKFKKTANQVDSVGNYLPEDWVTLKKLLVQLLSLPNQQLLFTFKRNQHTYNSKITSDLKVFEDQPFKAKLEFKGLDVALGQWRAYGYVLMTKKGLKLWFYKKYISINSVQTESRVTQQSTRKDQEITSRHNCMAFTSSNIDLKRGVITGKWNLYHDYYKGKHKVEEIGNWHIKRIPDIGKSIEPGFAISAQSLNNFV